MSAISRLPLRSTALAATFALLLASHSAAAQRSPLGDLRDRLEDATGSRQDSRRSDRTRSAPRTGNSRADRDAAVPVEQALEAITDFFLDISALAREDDGAWEMAQQQVQQYHAEMDAVLTPALIAQANDLSTRPTQRILARAERDAEQMAYRISGANPDISLAGTRRGTMFAQYGRYLSLREQLVELQRLYPDSVPIRQANQEAAAVLAQFGTFDSVEAQADANHAALVAENRLLPASHRDAGMERSFINAYWASPFANDYRGGEIVKMNLTSRSWTVHTNALGVPQYRDYGTSFAVRAPDGKCYAVRGVFEQRYSGGGGYGATRYASGDNSEILCENI